MCAQCAFRAGCETTREPYNVLKSIICELSGQPFFCHDQERWKEIDQPTRDQLRRFGICEGWKARVRERVAEGYFAKNHQYRQAMGKLAIMLLEEYIATPAGSAKRRTLAKLKEAVLLLKHKEMAPRIVRKRGRNHDAV